VLVIDRAYGLEEKVMVFKDEILKHPGALNGSVTSAIPGMSGWNGTVFQREDSPAEELFHFRLLRGDYEVLNTFGYELVDGRFFSKKFKSDSMAFVINETAAKDLGFKNPVGKKIVEITEGIDERTTHEIIGVVKDFHFNSLRDPIENLVIYLPRDYFPLYMSFRIDSKRTAEIIKHIEKTWKKMVPNQPFRYFFLEDNFNALHQTEQRTGKIFGVFSILAIFIASLGLLGLASFMAEQRTKEIGIRKVLGASVPEIVSLFSKEFILWGLMSNLVAWPVAYLVMKSWLQNFAYRVSMPYWAFFAAALISLFFAILTVSVQTIHAATKNPVKAISYE
jgi:putative ABC transport system permease protein